MLRIDPAAPPVWRTPDSVQFGVDPVLARLDGVPPGADHLVSALAAGTDRPTLDGLAKAAGLRRRAVDAMLARLEPALVPSVPSAPALRVAVVGDPLLRDLLATRLGLGPEPDRPDLVLIAALHVVPAWETVRWLADDVPHLPVVYGDQAVIVGPHVVPGATPCLRCADEHRLEDPAWRAIAAQLLRRRTARTVEAVPLGLHVAARLADLLRTVREGDPTGLEGEALRFAPDGTVSRVPRPWHERCWCRRPPAAPAPSGTVTPSASPGAAPPTSPTTAAPGPAPA